VAGNGSYNRVVFAVSFHSLRFAATLVVGFVVAGCFLLAGQQPGQVGETGNWCLQVPLTGWRALLLVGISTGRREFLALGGRNQLGRYFFYGFGGGDVVALGRLILVTKLWAVGGNLEQGYFFIEL